MSRLGCGENFMNQVSLPWLRDENNDTCVYYDTHSRKEIKVDAPNKTTITRAVNPKEIDYGFRGFQCPEYYNGERLIARIQNQNYDMCKYPNTNIKPSPICEDVSGYKNYYTANGKCSYQRIGNNVGAATYQEAIQRGRGRRQPAKKLDSLTCEQLRDLCKKRKISGYSKATKKELIKLLNKKP